MEFQNENVFGYVAPQDMYPTDSLKNELIDVVITDITYPTPYLKKLKEIEATTQIPQIPSFKRGGVALKVTTLYRSRSLTEEPTEMVHLQNAETGALEEPGYPIHMELIMDPITGIYERGFDFNTNLPDSSLRNGNIKLIDYLPRASKTKNWKTGKTIDEMVQTDDEYDKYMEMEKKRINDWTQILTQWKEWDENKCKHALLNLLARKYLICQSKDDSIAFCIPEVGMVFRLGVKGDSRYPNPVAYGFVKDENNKSQLVRYSSLSITGPTPASVKMAELVSKARDAAAKARMEAKAQTAQVAEPSGRPF